MKEAIVSLRDRETRASPLRVVTVGVLALLVPLVAGAQGGAEPGSFIEKEALLTVPSLSPYPPGASVDVKHLKPMFVLDESDEAGDKDVPLKSTVDVLNEDFEGAFPGVWAVSGAGGVEWGDTNYRSHLGSWSVWCAEGGPNGQPPGSNYLNDMNTWMIFGPFSLSDATEGSLSFWLWNDSEVNFDWVGWGVSLDGSSFGVTMLSGATSGWERQTVDFTDVSALGDVTGQSSVWVAFFFQSDSSNTKPGAYIDDVLIQKSTDGTPDLVVLSPSNIPSTVEPGESFTTSATVRNRGSENSSSTTLNWYWSENSTIGPDDHFITTDSVPALTPGGTSPESISGSFRNFGEYWLGGCVDPVAGEDNTGNNCSSGARVTVEDDNDCTPSSTTMCLQNNRFEVSIDYRFWNETTGLAQCATPMTDDSGLFYYTNPENWEFLIKILNGCANNGHYWVFFAATTNQEFTVRVRDTETNLTRTYFNPLYQSADAITDTRAFATCP